MSSFPPSPIAARIPCPISSSPQTPWIDLDNVPDRRGAHDRYQESAARTLGAARNGKPIRNLAAYRRGCESNLKADEARKGARWKALLASWHGPIESEDHSGRLELVEAVQVTLGRLTPEELQVVVLHGLKDVTFEMIAETTGMSRSRVYRTWERACLKFDWIIAEDSAPARPD